MVSDWKQKVVENFDGGAKTYDQYNDIQNMVAKNLTDELPEFNAPQILEIGCGTGTLTQNLLKYYEDGQFHITDISARMVEQAQKRIGLSDKIKWDVMDGENLSTNQSYDLIIGSMAFQWFEDIEKSLGNLQKYLKPNGQIIYAIPSPDSFEEWHMALKDLSLGAGTLNFKKPPGIFKEDTIKVQYKTTLDFLKSIKRLGAHTAHNSYKHLNQADLRRACREADSKFHGKITWQILYGRLCNQEL